MPIFKAQKAAIKRLTDEATLKRELLIGCAYGVLAFAALGLFAVALDALVSFIETYFSYREG